METSNPETRNCPSFGKVYTDMKMLRRHLLRQHGGAPKKRKRKLIYQR